MLSQVFSGSFKLMPTDESDLQVLTELQERMGSALQELPIAQKQVLEMGYYQGKSQSDIAQELDLPLGTVKTRSRQGLLKLRQFLQDLVE